MILDSGVCTVFRVTSTEGTVFPPKKSLEKKSEHLFGMRVVGVTRYYEAAKVGQRIDLSIRIWWDDSISVRDVCRVNGRYYLIRQVTPNTDEDGLLVTDLALENDDDTIRGWADEGDG